MKRAVYITRTVGDCTFVSFRFVSFRIRIPTTVSFSALTRIMRPLQMPYMFEDRTGHVAKSDYDDIYDRMFLRVVPHPRPPAGNSNVVAIYSMGRRSTRHGDKRHLERQPSVILEFAEGATGGLGNVNFFYPPAPSLSIPMSRYLRKTTFFGGYGCCSPVWILPELMYHRSLSRKFRASDGREYRWEHRSPDGHEWSVR